MPLRERKKLRTRDNIIRAATELFEKRGFDHVTVDEIAEAAEVSRATYFRYFPTKDAVVFPFQNERLALFRSLLEERLDGESPFDSIRRACGEMGRIFISAREELLIQNRIITGSELLIAKQADWDTEWEKAITSRLHAKMGRRRADYERAMVIGGAIFGVIRAILREWYNSGCRSDLEQQAGRAFDFIEKGVAVWATEICKPQAKETK